MFPQQCVVSRGFTGRKKEVSFGLGAGGDDPFREVDFFQKVGRQDGIEPES